MTNEKFLNELNQHKIQAHVSTLVRRAWKGELEKNECLNTINPVENKNITSGCERVEHKKHLAYFFKRIFNFLYKDYFEETETNYYYRFPHFLDSNFFKIKTSLKSINKNVRSIDGEELIERFIYSGLFQILLVFSIVLNSIMLGMQTDVNFRKKHENILKILECFANSVFLMEFILKVFYGFKVYWHNPWNIFDFFLLVVSLISIMFDQENSVSVVDTSNLFRIFRVFRALRSLRSINIFSKMQIIVNTFFQSIFDIINMVILMLLTMIMFSLFGCSLFGETNEINEYFGNLDAGILTLFYCATREGLSSLFNALEESNEYYWFKLLWKSFLVIVIIIFAFVLTNLIVAIVVTNMEKALKEYEKNIETDLQMKSIKGSDQLSTNLNENEPLDFVRFKDIADGFPWSMQKPLQNSILQDLNIIDLEKYYLILNCLENNSTEYCSIKKRLDKVIVNLENHLEKFEKDTNDLSSDESLTCDYSAENSEVDWHSEFNITGDILSNLVNLEKKNIFSSKKLCDFKSISMATRKRALIDFENKLSVKKSQLSNKKKLN